MQKLLTIVRQKRRKKKGKNKKMIYWGISKKGAAFHKRTMATYDRAVCNPYLRLYGFIHPDNVHNALLCRRCLLKVEKSEDADQTH